MRKHEQFAARLANTDKDRIRIRETYKLRMRSVAAEQTSESGTDFVFFPKSILSQNNDQLRFGLSWLFNGFIVKAGSMTLAVDPGVNFLLRATDSGFNLAGINTLYISHLHLDHSADANALMDWLIRAQAQVQVLAPLSVYKAQAISSFHSGDNTPFPVRHSSKLINNKTIICNDDAQMTFFSLSHGLECYGFTLIHGDHIISYISDTGYAEEVKVNGKLLPIAAVRQPSATTIVSYRSSIKTAVADSTTIIVNIDSFLHGKNSGTHLSITDLIHLLNGAKARKIILAHINPIGELSYDQWGKELAEYVQEVTGIETICPDRQAATIAIV